MVIESGQDGWYVVHVPALPGCWTQGRTHEEALVNAREAIEVHVEGLIERGEPVPDDHAEVVEIAEVEVAVA